LAVPIFADLERFVTISPTIAISQAASRTWDAIVIGAGPAGSVAARELSRQGVKTLLVDKSSFPRSKVCGSCLNGRVLASLAEIGLGDLPASLDAVPLTRFQLASGGASASISLPAGVALSRTAFDASLVEQAVLAGAHFLPSTSVRTLLSDQSNDTASVELRSVGVIEVAEARVLIVASGLNGAPSHSSLVDASSRIGAGAVFERAPECYSAGTIFMAVGRRGYVGIVRVEDGGLDVAAAFDAEFVKSSGGLGYAAANVLAECRMPALDQCVDAPWKGTPALTRSSTSIAGRRWFAVGDAAGYVEPFTGEGMAWAIASGVAVAPLAVDSVGSWRPELVREWEAVHALVVRSRQSICRVTSKVLRSPRLSRLLVGALSLAPFLSRPIVRALNRPTPSIARVQA
jgi:menaquinone-9 beta-reductase